MTKKQIAALDRIISREQFRKRDSHDSYNYGIHPSNDVFAVTDGCVCVILQENIEDFRMADRCNFFEDIVQEDLETGTHSLSDTKIDAAAWKKAARSYNRKVDKGLAVEVHAVDNSGNEVWGEFDPQLILDAVEVVGAGAMLYLGYGCPKGQKRRHPTLLVLPKDWMDGSSTNPYAYVLPLKV